MLVNLVISLLEMTVDQNRNLLWTMHTEILHIELDPCIRSKKGVLVGDRIKYNSTKITHKPLTLINNTK